MPSRNLELSSVAGPIEAELVQARRQSDAAREPAPRQRRPVKRQRAKRNSLEDFSSKLFSTTAILVRLAGIEPTTPWFVAKYSIQLSYSRERQDYSRALAFCEGCRTEILIHARKASPARPCPRHRRKKARRLTPPGFFSTTILLVRLAGIEPTTPWFVAKYSIQLSYSRAGQHYSRGFEKGEAFCMQPFSPVSALRLAARAKRRASDPAALSTSIQIIF
jgi:hypothetical protein